jgi:hypothetical protein
MFRRLEGEAAGTGGTQRIFLNRELMAAQPEVLNRAVLERVLNPELSGRITAREAPGRLTLPIGPAQPPLAPVPAPVPIVPAAPGANPFAELPYPAPGDRIKADDFKKLSQSLKIISDMALLSAQLFGRTLGEAKGALAGQGYMVGRVMSVFGSEPGGPTDTSFDGRRVLQVLPAGLGDKNVLVLVSEAVETRRFTPNFTTGGVGYTYRQAVETMRSVLGEAGMAGLPMDAPSLLQRTLAQAARDIG